MTLGERWKACPADCDASAAGLGIETSCDETAAAVLAADGAVLAEAVLSQAEHARVRRRRAGDRGAGAPAHLPGLVRDVLARAGLAPAELGGVAATTGPGLIGGLIVGSRLGKGMALAAGLPFVAVNHLEAHALTARLTGRGVAFPYLLLLVSGGHCQCVAVDGVGRYRRLGGTIDDAVGEAFDKVGKLLGLPWPGGPHVERLAAGGDPARHAFPRPLLRRPGCDFSFSGLKTAVAQAVRALPPGAARAEAADVAAGFQAAVADVMADRAAHALALHAGGGRAGGRRRGRGQRRGARRAGGVAARHGVPMVAPPLRLCGDNAVMVAWAGIERLRLGLADPLDTAPRPRWPLDEMRGRVNYRHAFHAGNFADCTKHALLVWLLRALARKPAPFAVLDTHAGAGRYDLSGAAERTGEWRAGIARLLHEPPAPLADYVAVVEAAGLYPGSPAIARALLRPARPLACCELHPEDARRCAACSRGDAQVAVHARDGWDAMRALLPPAAKRGLVLDRSALRGAGRARPRRRRAGHRGRRFPAGWSPAWYPIKHRAPVRALHGGRWPASATWWPPSCGCASRPTRPG